MRFQLSLIVYKQEIHPLPYIIISQNFTNSFLKNMHYNSLELKENQNQVNKPQFQDDALLNEYEMINQYLNLDFSFSNQSYSQHNSCTKSSESSGKIALKAFLPVKMMPTSIKKQKSSFHNFQKHLITVIKKFIHFSKNKLSGFPFSPISYSIWMAFQESNANNKKTLNFVFGSSVINNKVLGQNLSKESDAFKDVFISYSEEEINLAQALLRERVVAQARTLSKHFLRSNSNVRRFQEFYLYFCNFISELENGPLGRRLTKHSKKKILGDHACKTFE